MVVHQNRVRRAYLKKRSVRELYLGGLILFFVIMICGFVAVDDRSDARAMMSTWTPERRVCIVNWADPPMYDVGR